MARAKLSALGEQQAAQGTVWLIEMQTVAGYWVPLLGAANCAYFAHSNAMRSLNRLRKRPTGGEYRISLYVRQEAAGQAPIASAPPASR